MKASGLAVLCAAISLAAVSAATSAVSHFATTLDGMTIVPGFADIRFMVNRGVSFNLLAQDSHSGANLLTLGTAALTVALCVWAWRTTSPRLGIAQGTVIGGAIYNTGDRALHGGVFDFLFVHVGALPLFVCNAADIAISVGAVLLLLSMIWEPRSGAAA